jgi:starch-binding outer membrane protein, SusD/RagB family
MKLIKIIPLVFTIFTMIFISCSKDWLKPAPLSFFAPENVFVDEAGFESGLVVCRKQMNSESHDYISYLAAEHAYSDLAISPWASDFSQNTPSHEPYYFQILELFTKAYGYIKDANVIITRIDNITWTDKGVRNRILSEAYWFRAYWYYRLVNTYGDVPWIGGEVQGAKLDYHSTSRSAILGKLQKDMEFAVGNLPERAATLGNVTKGAANHLLAKIYLANGEFDKAIEAATSVIQGPYALMTQRFGVDVSKGWHDLMWDLHRIENKNLSSNTETIYATVDRSDASPETWYLPGDSYGTYSARSYAPAYWRVPDATGGRASNWTFPQADTCGRGIADVRPTAYFYYKIWGDATHNWSTTSDMRRSNGNWIEMGPTESEIHVWDPASPQFGQPLTKLYYKSLADTLTDWWPYPMYKTYTPTPFGTPMGGQGDWYVFRLAETYLLRAEAYYWKNQPGLAADDINKVRARANAPLISGADVTIDYIFDERARELYTEEPRHSEMVRVSCIMAKLNLGGYSLAAITQKNWYYDRVMRVNYFYNPAITYFGITAKLLPNNIFWPIPSSVITANTLGRINQNIGYDGDNLNVPPLEVIP